MDDIKINGKAIYTTKGAAREYGRVGCNFYTGCPHECSYCYLKRGAPSKQLGGNVVQLKKCFKDEDDALAKFNKEVERYKDVLQKTGVFFSFTTDPMIPETRKLTQMAMIEAYKRGIPVYVLTKDAGFFSEEN
jgi:DNA repair photolyase